MGRFFLYLIVGYLVYLYFIKPIVYGYRAPANKQKPNKGTAQKTKTPSDKEGEYIDYEEIK